MSPTLLILAAGMGSRYGGLKQVDPVGPSGETIMDYSIFDALRAGFRKVVFVIRHDIEQDFRATFTNKLAGKFPFSFAYQELDSLPAGTRVPAQRQKPWGTGHAVMVAAPLVQEAFAVINADDFYGFDAFKKMAEFLTTDANPSQYAMAGYSLGNTLSDFGHVSRGICKADDSHHLVHIAEKTHIHRQQDEIVCIDEEQEPAILAADSIVSMNFWGFKPGFFSQLEALFREFLPAAANIEKDEFYLSSAIDRLISSGQASVRILPTGSTWFGVTYKEDKPSVSGKVNSLVNAGIYPQSLW